MLEGPLRLASIVLSLLVVAGFGLFAVDEVRGASDATRAELASGRTPSPIDPTPAEETLREQAHGGLREAIDDANDVLLAPFATLTDDAGSEWAQRGAPALLGLLVFGFGLGYLARYARGGS